MNKRAVFAILITLVTICLVNPAIAYYNPQQGRFLTQDPIGITPDALQPNIFQVASQYNDSMGLYLYAGGNPVVFSDAWGLWGKMVHGTLTKLWAQFNNGMLTWAAESVGWWDASIDVEYNPVTLNHDTLGWHFDTEGETEQWLRWGSTDSRYLHAELLYLQAVAFCNNPFADDYDYAAYESLKYLGMALHEPQDWVAHGTWKPWQTLLHFPWHPMHTDDWGMDFDRENDGILRDWDNYGRWFAGKFVPGTKRNIRTKKMTLEYLDRYKQAISLPCYCRIYGPPKR